METRTVLLALIAILNFAAETLEKVIAEDGDGEDAAPSRKSRAKAKAKGKPKDEEEEDDADDSDSDSDEPSEDDVIDAVRGAQKVLEKADIEKILMKYGKVKRASEVKEEHRKKVIDALEKAVEAAAE